MSANTRRFLPAVFAAAAMLFTAAATRANEPYDTYRRPSQEIMPMPYSPVAYPGATSALWTNPAGIGADGTSGLLLLKPSSLDDRYGYANALSDDLAWGINLDGLGFGVEYRNGTPSARRYTLALGDEIVEGFTFGVAYHWSKGLPLRNSYDAGVLARPTRWLSLGAVAEQLIGGEWNGRDIDPTYRLGLAVRPVGPRLTLTGEVTVSEFKSYPDTLGKYRRINYGDKLNPTFTASARVLDGVTVNAGYAVDSEVLFGGLTFTFGHAEVGGWSGFRGESIENLPDDAGATWVRASSHWSPSLVEKFRPKKIVKMKLSGQLVEEKEPWSFFGEPEPTMFEMLDRMEQIAQDETVAGVWLEIRGLKAQLSDLEELRAAVRRLQDAGKKVVVYADQLSLGSYYLACAADEIYLLPTGMIAVPGLNLETLHLRRLLDKIRVTPQVEKIEEYKSAGEILTDDTTSAPVREMYEQFVETWWDEWLQAVADGRRVDTDRVQQWVDQALHTGRGARALGMVDTVAYDDEIDAIVRDAIAQDTPASVVGAGDYFRQLEPDEHWEDMTSPKVAVIFAEGPIMTGHSGRGVWGGDPYIGAETVAKAIREARTNRRVNAIVMRVDSPGGSASASDIIAREVKLTVDPEHENADPKPFIVSMSGVAASGGYYIACLADTIVAPKTTLTGSIGVLAVNLAYRELLDSLGITLDPVVRRGENADLFSAGTWNEEQRRIIRREIEAVYDDFTGLVAEGREMSVDRVDEIGRGRVWSGADAIGIDLVDLEGGLFQSIEVAKQAAGLDPHEVVDLELFMAEPGWGLDREIRAAAAGMMPDGVRELLVRGETFRRLQQESVQMLAPVDPDAVVVE
ncbi:MAG: Protease 4 [Calditrichaeota bacterium]|nr:Protease 4 [Calditrichota bacterium]